MRSSIVPPAFIYVISIAIVLRILTGLHTTLYLDKNFSLLSYQNNSFQAINHSASMFKKKPAVSTNKLNHPRICPSHQVEASGKNKL